MALLKHTNYVVTENKEKMCINEYIPSQGSHPFSVGVKLKSNPSPPDSCPLNTAWDWEMRAHLNQKLTFPPEIAVTNLHLDLVLCSKSC